LIEEVPIPSTFGVLHVDKRHDVGLEFSVLLLLGFGS
jgi:hypothetical protein